MQQASMPAKVPGRKSHVRPAIHFTAESWINDPCAPGYDAETKTYHLFYQCNPDDCEWGNMSWGHITSNDLLFWIPASSRPALIPDEEYDCKGVFTGCWLPPTNDGDKVLRVVYSSIKELPFHWSTPPYPRDAAGLAMAVSHDGGQTWGKLPQSPFLSGEPAGVQVTGFRDPYASEWHAMDQARATSENALYGLVSGGIEGSGPTSFLYEIQLENLNTWKYLRPLVDIPLRFQPSKKWSGNYGVNWECVNFMTLRADSESRHFLIIGAEGDVEKDHVRNYTRPEGLPPRTVRAQLWMSGSLTDAGDGVTFRYECGGYLDHGPYYAANSFSDPISGRRIVHGWIPEEDVPIQAAQDKGWNGSLAIPREVFLLRISNVQRALHSDLSEISCFESKVELDGSTTMSTLGVRPIREVARLRGACQQVLEVKPGLNLPRSETDLHETLFGTSTATWELESTISIRPGCETVGFHVRHNQDMSIRLTITFNISAETLVVDRDASTIDSTTNKCPDAGPFTLFCRGGLHGSKACWEKFQLRVFSDGDTLEVFANDRFALATMVYSESYGRELGGVTAFATGTANSTVFEAVTVWDGLKGTLLAKAFDTKPDSTVKLVVLDQSCSSVAQTDG